MAKDLKVESVIQVDAQYRNKCVNKWRKLLEATNAPKITNPHTRGTVAVLLENQSKLLKEEAAGMNSGIWGAGTGVHGGSLGNSDFYANGDNRAPKVILPMIRRTFPELIANEVVGVQPMSVPVSLAFAMRYRYDGGPLHVADRAGDVTVGQRGVQVEGVQGGILPQSATTAGAEMGFNYLDNTWTGKKEAKFNRTLNPATNLPWSDDDIVSVWVKSAVAATVGKDLTGVTTVAEIKKIAAGEVVLTVTPSDEQKAAAAKLLEVTSIAGGAFTFSDQDLGTAALVGDYEATGRVPKTKFTFEKKAVEAGTRRIGTSWTLELEQDIRNMNGINIENEVTSMMSYELQAEIDREMIVRMLYAALSANEYSFWDGSKADARWMAERDRAFYQFIIQQSNRMTLRNRRGPANFIIATPDVCSLFETLPQYAVMEVTGNVNTNSAGIAKVGTLGNGRFTIFRDTRTPVQNNAWINNGWDNQAQYTVGGAPRTTGIPDFALLGYKGSEYWDAGIIFCPYIPVMLQRVVDPVSYEPNVGLMTRYGVVDNLFGSNLYYHVVLINTLTNVLPSSTSPANTFPGRYATTTVDMLAPEDGSAALKANLGPVGATLPEVDGEPAGYPVKVMGTVTTKEEA